MHSHVVTALPLVLMYYTVENYKLFAPDALQAATFIVRRTAL